MQDDEWAPGQPHEEQGLQELSPTELSSQFRTLQAGARLSCDVHLKSCPIASVPALWVGSLSMLREEVQGSVSSSYSTRAVCTIPCSSSRLGVVGRQRQELLLPSCMFRGLWVLMWPWSQGEPTPLLQLEHSWNVITSVALGSDMLLAINVTASKAEIGLQCVEP